MKSRGFTLVELLAVIVILGVLIIIAIPSITEYITSSRGKAIIEDGRGFIDAARNKATTERSIPLRGKCTCYKISDLEFDKGAKSPYGKKWNNDYSFVKIINETDGITTKNSVKYKIQLADVDNNCLETDNEGEKEHLILEEELEVGDMSVNCEYLKSFTEECSSCKVSG